jgi:adenylate cyclase
LLRGLSIRPTHAGVIALIAVFAGALASWLVAVVRWPLATAGLVIGIGAILFAAAHAAFLWARLWIPVTSPLLALGLSYSASTVASVIREQRQRRRLSRYFSPAVVTEIVRDDEDRLASRRREVTVFFSDIRGFTALSEKMEPERIVRFLREYLTVMTEVVFRHGGTVDKYVGDAIMALYNVPFDQPDHAARAVRTALEFQARLREVTARYDEPLLSRLECGVGIHTGEAVVGTIGSEQRLEYTAIGDTINIGARLEGLTKEYGAHVIISESTYRAVRDEFAVHALGVVPIRGRDVPVRIFEVRGPLPAGGHASRPPDDQHREPLTAPQVPPPAVTPV